MDISRRAAFLAASLAFILLSLASASVSYALPFFSRQIGRDCTFCHTVLPKLNEKGRAFRSNGYRFEAEGEWREVKDLTTLPVSFEAEVEGVYDNVKTNGVKTEASDMKVEEAEVTAGGAFGKTGKATALVAIAVAQDGDTFEASIPMAFIQVNDLAGPAGAGLLNLRAGQAEVGLPFLTANGSPISNRYLADRKLNLISSEVRLVELNGAYEHEKEASSIVHRYSAGVSREDINSDDKLKGLYAAYSVTYDEFISLGAIFRYGKEQDGNIDVVARRYGLAAEADAGPVTVTFGFFRSERQGLPDIEDFMLEALYRALPGLSFAARFDAARQGSGSAKSQTFMARYNILSNVYAQLEYRHLTDSVRITGGGELENKARAVLVAVF